MQQLVCPQCSADVPAENVNIDKVVAVCPACNTVFSFDFLTGEATKDKDKAKSKARARHLHPPDGFKIDERPDGSWVLSWGWFTPQVFFMTFFVIIWDAFLIFWYRMAFGIGDGFGGGPSGFGTLFVLFPLIHVAVGVSLTYNVIATYLNRTYVTLKGDEIKVRSLPLPFPWRENTLPMEDITQLYVKKGGQAGFSFNTSTTYSVMAQRYTANDTVLVGGLNNTTLALFIEQELERYLEIEDEQVFGEVKRSR